VRRGEDFEPVFAAMGKDRPDGLFYMAAGGMMRDHEKRAANLALKNRLPSAFASRAAVEGGGLIGYGADLQDSYRRVAIYVDKILKGAKPADLPVEQPTKFELVINLKTANQIGLIIPPNVLARADRVIR
jgi:putative ABC transport system substrate-binding protein